MIRERINRRNGLVRRLALSEDEYEPMSAEEIEEALCDYDPLSDFIEDESSVGCAVPGEEQDQHKSPKFAPVAKPGVFLGYRLEPGGKWKGDCYVADLEQSTKSSRFITTLKNPMCFRFEGIRGSNS